MHVSAITDILDIEDLVMRNVLVLLFDPNGQADLVPSACTQCTRILVGFSIYAIFLFDEHVEAVSVRLFWPSLNFVCSIQSACTFVSIQKIGYNGVAVWRHT